MADRFVKSSAAGANNGTSWTDAYTSLSSAATAAVAGDTIYVHNTHSQSFGATSTTLTFGNNRANLVNVISVNDALEPTLGAYAGCTSANCIIAGCCYVWGVDFSSSTWGATHVAPAQNGFVVLDKCTVGNTLGTGSTLLIGSTFGQVRVRFRDVVWKVNGASSVMDIRAVDFLWEGGRVDLLSGTPTAFASLGSNVYVPTRVDLSGIDLSSLPASINLFTSPTDTLAPTRAAISRCKLPTGWSGLLCANARTDARMDACDSSGEIQRSQLSMGPGSVYTDQVVYRNAGAVVHGFPVSWRMVTSASAGENNPLTSLEMFRAWPGTPEEVGAWAAEQSLTVTAEVLTDGITLKDSECWIEVKYFDAAGSSLGSLVSDARDSILAAPSNQQSSVAAWVSPGISTPTKQKLSVTVTPGEAAYVTASVKVGRPSSTVYVCPKIEVS